MSDMAIFCAKCGAAGQRAASYCRSCGEWLPDPSATGRLPGRLRGLSPERKQRRIYTLELLSALAAAAAAVISFAVHFDAHPDMVIVTALLCLMVVVWQGVAFFLGRSIQMRRSQEPAAEGGPELPPAQGVPRRSLRAADTGNLVRPPSVTEDPTALLDPVPLKRREKG